MNRKLILVLLMSLCWAKSASAISGAVELPRLEKRASNQLYVYAKMSGVQRQPGATTSTNTSQPKTDTRGRLKNGRCDALVFRRVCTRDMVGVGKACNGKYAECRCIYQPNELKDCQPYETCAKIVCGNKCLKCVINETAVLKATPCPEGYSRDITYCKWPLTLLSKNGCGKCDPNCPAGTSINTRYCPENSQIQVNAAGCGRCVPSLSKN